MTIKRELTKYLNGIDTDILCMKLKVSYQLRDLAMEGRILLKLILKK